MFSVFKRGIIGVYPHCGEAHLHRYIAEFDYRYKLRAALKVADTERAEDLLRIAHNRRLTYWRGLGSPVTPSQKVLALMHRRKKPCM